MKIGKNNSRKSEALTEITSGKLDEAVDSGLDRILAAMKSDNGELDSLLAKARG
jgi:hypothetical protein